MDAPTLTRSWPALAAVGAGLLLLALGAGALAPALGGPRSAAAAAIAAALMLLGGAALAWAIATLRSGRPVSPRLGISGALLGILGSVIALLSDPARTSIVAIAAAVLLLVIVGSFCASAVGRRSGARQRDGRTGMIGMIIGSAVVAALVTPALAATEVGRLAPDHSSHSVFEQHSH
ncbi:hypothetical protein ACSBPH_06520 [Microbacterium sp. F51-2R]|jgi:hypothetical protein|uniref:hypothetical protein n=1 Tax=Microbacterium sp. F51-2R TaxID=3445777 RepID=UPI003FA0128F